jgi:hypothetical protein
MFNYSPLEFNMLLKRSKVQFRSNEEVCLAKTGHVKEIQIVCGLIYYTVIWDEAPQTVDPHMYRVKDLKHLLPYQYRRLKK